MEWIGETFTSNVGWNHLETLVDLGNRMAGTDGERQAAAATRDLLSEYTRAARVETFDIRGWTRGTSSIQAAGETLEGIALPRSPAGEPTAELVDLGHGLPADFQERDVDGKVVACAADVPAWFDRHVHRREKYYRAVAGGAVAFVFRNHVSGCLAPTGSVGTSDNPIGPIPAVGVSKEVGDRLIRRHEGDLVSVSVTLGDAPVEATSRNVHAELGPATDERLLITSHVDAHDIGEGAMDNAAGTAIVVELARTLATREADLQTKVEFVVFGAEEVGLRGSEHLAAQVEPDAVTAVVNNDGVVRGRNLAFATHGFADLDTAIDRLAQTFDHPLTTVPRHSPHSDHWPFVTRGVPGFHVYSGTSDGGRGWGHTRADTLDKLDRRDLRESAILLTELVVDLARTDVTVTHRDPQAIARELESQDLAEGMKVTGDWPFDT